MNSALAVVDPGDIFLSPHSGDVCFSLGLLAWHRRRGTLLTVFPRSGYRAGHPRALGVEARAVTRMRMEEDAEFAKACGLSASCLDFQGASDLGWSPFGSQHRAGNADRIEAALLRSLTGPTLGRTSTLRPWLFCPAGIGDHVDHVAVRTVIARHLDALGHSYRVAFYEDLHYAADPEKRRLGLSALADAVGGRILSRYWWPLGEQQRTKLSLIRIYRSQLTAQLNSIAAFTPAAEGQAGPHEAIWALRSDVGLEPQEVLKPD
jgi:hypothetical protein